MLTKTSPDHSMQRQAMSTHPALLQNVYPSSLISAQKPVLGKTRDASACPAILNFLLLLSQSLRQSCGMIEPNSVIAAAKLVGQGATQLYSFIKGIGTVDAVTKALYEELNVLANTADTVGKTLQKPELQVYQDAELWTDADDTLKACQVSLRQLKKSCTGLKAGPGGRNLVERGLAQAKLEMKGEAIQKARDQLSSHTMALQIVIAMVNIHVSSKNPQIILDQVNPQLDLLTKMVQKLLEAQEKMKREDLDDHTSAIVMTHQRVADSARSLIHEMSVAGDARSTIFGGTKLDLDFRVRDWAENLHEEYTELPGAVKESDKATDIAEDMDSDDEYDVLFLTQYIKLAREDAREGNHVSALHGFQRALEKERLFTRLQDPLCPDDIRYEQALSLIQTDRLDEALAIYGQLTRLSNTIDDASRNRLKEILYSLARLLFSKGYVLEAQWHCEQAVRALRRTDQKSDPCFSAMALMSSIYRAQGNELDGRVWEGLLPKTFVKPTFKIPSEAVIRARLAEQEQKLRLAAEKGDMKTVVSLLNFGASVRVTEPCKPRRTLLHLAAKKGHEVVVDLLLKRGAALDTLDDFEQTPLHLAADQGHKLIVELLLNQGADKDACDKQGQTPLALAVTKGYESVTDLLLTKGASTELARKDGSTPLHLAAKLPHDAITKMLRVKGANVEAVDSLGRTPLHYAARYGGVTSVKTLLDGGANIEALTNYKSTPLHNAAAAGHDKVVKVLLDQGANVEACSERGGTPLYCAAYYGHDAVLKILLDTGANTDALTKDKQTPLHGAAAAGQESASRLLVKHGANKTARNITGHTPFDLVQERPALKELLKPPTPSTPPNPPKPASRRSSSRRHER